MARINIIMRAPTVLEKLKSNGLTQEDFDWCCAICTHATHLSAGVQKRVDERLFRVAYLGVRPAMESALKCIWKMTKVRGKPPDNLRGQVIGVEKVYKIHNLFSVQMEHKDKFGNSAYRKVNGWAHADILMWRPYKNGEEIDHVLKPMKNMVSHAQCMLQHYDPTLVSDHKYWSTKYE